MLLAGEAVLCTTDTFFEGVDFDLTYFPLKHLGYKVVTAAISDLLAMNARPAQLTVSLGVSTTHYRGSPPAEKYRGSADTVPGRSSP